MSENMETIPTEVVADTASIPKLTDEWASIYVTLGAIAFVII
jgi:hypothetical protein